MTRFVLIKEEDEMLLCPGLGGAKPCLTLCRIKASTFQTRNLTARAAVTRYRNPLVV